jgi:hypothetical protein
MALGAFAIPLLAALLALIAGIVLAAVLRRLHFRRDTREAQIGLGLLNGLGWRDMAQLVVQMLKVRGYELADTARTPGAVGYDLTVTRGAERYFVVCKHGNGANVGAAPVRDLLTLVSTQDARGGILVTTGRFAPDAVDAAHYKPLQLLEGPPLWRELKPFVSGQLLGQVERSLAAGGGQRLAREAGLTLAAAALAFAVAMGLQPRAGAPQSGPNPVPTSAPVQAAAPPPAASKPAPTAPPSAKPVPVTPPAAAASVASTPAGAAAPAEARAPVPSAPAEVHPMPPALSGADELDRRLAVLDAVRKLDGVVMTDWSTKSTLIAVLKPDEQAQRDALVARICAAVVAYEELRFTRLQVEDAPTTANAPKRVHWHQCK